MATIRVAGHTIAEHDIVSDKVDIKNATLASSVSLTDEYYLQGKVDAAHNLSGTSNLIYFDGTTQPYWVLTGDTTNFVQGNSSHYIKLLKAGIYNINASLTGYLNNDSERVFELYLNGVKSGTSSVLAQAADSVTAADSSYTYSNVCVSYTGKFSSNDEIGFNTASATGQNITLSAVSHFSICLIRPL